jgi:uncharacterized protein YbjT (DUF2867 family)
LDVAPSQNQGKSKLAAKRAVQFQNMFLVGSRRAAVDCRKERGIMKIVVIGGSGLIGSKLVNRLRERGHDVLAASPSTGVNSITREGLAEAMLGANTVVDVSNSPSFEDKPVMEFFDRSTRNLLAASTAAAVSHYVALSIVGLERLPDSGYLRAKLAQETLIKASGIPYSLLRATQFLEFLPAIIAGGTEGDTIRLSSAHFQPIASDDVVAALTDVVLGAPRNGTTEVGGPERAGMDAFARRYLAAQGDRRTVIGDPAARYFGAVPTDQSLTTGPEARIGALTLDAWLKRTVRAA